MADPCCLVTRYIADVLAHEAVRDAKVEAAVVELENAGRRIVDGGPTETDHDSGHSRWEYLDWRTNAVLYSGGGTDEQVQSELAKLDPEDRWYHIDNVEMSISCDGPARPSGLPESLAIAISDWVVGHNEEARALLQAGGIRQP